MTPGSVMRYGYIVVVALTLQPTKQLYRGHHLVESLARTAAALLPQAGKLQSCSIIGEYKDYK